ncbi:hypothetical protein ABZ484_15115 [Streptomyces sp. NPDC006393]
MARAIEFLHRWRGDGEAPPRKPLAQRYGIGFDISAALVVLRKTGHFDDG